MSERYNGWANYETWSVALWLDNEAFSYHYWRERARECLEEATKGRSLSRAEQASAALASLLKEELEEGSPLAEQATLYADLLGSALSDVNWHEIAKHYLEGVTAS
jgi:hypothetical protein